MLGNQTFISRFFLALADDHFLVDQQAVHASQFAEALILLPTIRTLLVNL